MHVPAEDELAAIAAAYLTLRREPPPPPPPVSRWRLAARVLDDPGPERLHRRGARPQR